MGYGGCTKSFAFRRSALTKLLVFHACVGQVTTPGIDTSAYTVDDGYVSIPHAPGFGLVLDEAIFKAAVERETGLRFGKPSYAT